MIKKLLNKKIIFLLLVISFIFMPKSVFALETLGMLPPSEIYVSNGFSGGFYAIRERFNLPFNSFTAYYNNNITINANYSYVLQICTNFAWNSGLTKDTLAIYADNIKCNITDIVWATSTGNNGMAYTNIGFSCAVNATSLYIETAEDVLRLSKGTSGTGYFEYYWWRYDPAQESQDSVMNAINNIGSAIGGLGESIKDTNDAIMDDNIDNDTGNDFFNNFEDSDNGGISAIITKPLTLINGLLSSSDTNSCQPLSINILGKGVELPCGKLIWGLAPQNITILYHTIVCGYLAYIILKKLFKDIEGLKEPEDKGVSTLDL